MDECLSNTDLVEKCPTELRQVSSAFVGFEAAVVFFDFVKNYDKSLTAEDIMDNGLISATSDFTINEHMTLLQKIDSSLVMHRPNLTEDQARNFAEYFITLDPEIAMKAWTVLGSGTLDNTILTHNVETKSGLTVADRMLEIVGEDDD